MNSNEFEFMPLINLYSIALQLRAGGCLCLVQLTVLLIESHSLTGEIVYL